MYTWSITYVNVVNWYIVAPTRKNAEPVQGWWKQAWTMLCCPQCSMLSTILFSIVTPDCELIQAQQCWTILLIIVDNIEQCGQAQHCSHLFSSTLNKLCIFCCVHGKKSTTCSGLMKTALNNAVLSTLFNVVNNIVQHCWAWISPQSGVNNAEQYCWQHWTMWAAQHCSCLFSSTLNRLCVFTRVDQREGGVQYTALSILSSPALTVVSPGLNT